MSTQIDALAAEVARNTKATQALVDAAKNQSSLTPLIEQLKLNNSIAEAATAELTPAPQQTS